MRKGSAKTNHHFPLGDTLIEVMMAIGIFSLVAIAVVSVVNGGNSDIQTTLESTMARNEIDAQAEALRFIQSAYIAERTDNSEQDKSNQNSIYQQLWKKIVSRAIRGDSPKATFTTPATCGELYKDDSTLRSNGFILNTKMLGSITKDNLNNIAVFGSNILTPASLYPRLIFKNDSYENLLDMGDNSLWGAEGIYIVAVQDSGSIVVGADGNKASAFYDFYINTCWYGSGADVPSTISTIVRLYDPDVEVVDYSLTEYAIIYDGNGGENAPEPQRKATTDSSVTFKIPDLGPAKSNNDFMGWSANGNCNDVSLPGDFYSLTNKNPIVTLKAVWQCDYTLAYSASGASNVPATQQNLGSTKKTWTPIISSQVPTKANSVFWYWTYNNQKYYPGKSIKLTAPDNARATLTAKFISNFVIQYNNNGDGIVPSATICKPDTSNDAATTNCKISAEVPTRTGYKFQGWAETPSGDVKYQAGGTIVLSQDKTTVTLYAKWRQQNDVITIKLTFPSRDCDAHVEGQKSDNTWFHAYFSAKVGSDISGLTIASLDVDRTSGGTETFTLNTSGGKTYYYYVHNYSSCSLSSSTYVTISSKNGDFSTKTYRITDATGGWSSKYYWNVFAYKDGRIVDRMTRSSSPQTSY